MSGQHNFSKLLDQVLARPGGLQAVQAARDQTLEEVRLYQLRHAEAVSQAELADDLADIHAAAAARADMTGPGQGPVPWEQVKADLGLT